MASIKVTDFNKQYKTNDVNLNSFDFITKEEFKEKETKQLSGKVQSVWKDVIKRFFKNKWNVLFSIVLITLFSMVIIVPIVSEFNAKDPVSNAATESISFTKPDWMDKWNLNHQTYDLSDYYKYYNNNGVGPFDKSLVISATPVVDAHGNTISMTVDYVNKYAIHTVMGTDSIGRDVWTRLFAGARWSISLALIVATVETIIGTVIGIYLGYHVGKATDTVVMRFIEIFKSVPGMLWMFIFTMVIGTSFMSMAFVLILVGWVGPVYTARMFTLKVKDAEFIKAAQSIGVSETGILFKHVLPNIIGRLLVSFVHRIPAVIFAETTLVFLGMPVGGEDKLSIGNLIADARSLEAIRLNIMYAVSISIFLLTLTISLQIIANGIRDAFDPKTSGGK